MTRDDIPDKLWGQEPEAWTEVHLVLPATLREEQRLLELMGDAVNWNRVVQPYLFIEFEGDQVVRAGYQPMEHPEHPSEFLDAELIPVSR